MLAGLEGVNRPGHMEMVGKRVVDGVDLGIGEQGLVAAMGAGDAQFFGSSFCRGRISGANRDDFAQIATLHGGNHLLRANFCSTQDSPADAFHIYARIDARYHPERSSPTEESRQVKNREPKSRAILSDS